MHQLAGRAVEALNRAHEHGEAYARYVGEELHLSAQKPAEWQAAVLRLMAQDNPLVAGKPHSASSADKVVETDPAYRQLLDDLRAVVVYKERAHVAFRVELERATLYRTLIERGMEVAA